MKAILLFIVLGLTFTYNPSAAVEYSNKYCSHYNSAYNNYAGQGGDCANFVSQCLKAGGFSFSGCSGQDNKGMIPGVSNLKSCLKSKGWKSSSSKPSGFKAGYPVFVKSYSHAMLAVGFSGSDIKVGSHTNDRCGDAFAASKLDFYYP